MEIQDKGDFYSLSFSRMDILNLCHSFNGTETDKARFLLEKVLQMVPDIENVNIEVLRKRIIYFNKKLTEFWKKAWRNIDKLKEINKAWLEQKEIIELRKYPDTTAVFASTSNETIIDISSCSGRPKTEFSECSKRTKRRRLAELSKVDETAVNFLIDTSGNSDTNSSEVSPDEVLSLITEAKLTKHQYILIKEFINSRKFPTLPSYQKILESKKRCYPLNQIVTEIKGEVELQSLLDHTATRILDSQKEVLSSVPLETLGDLFLIGKWGFDGSTGHSEYKQCFADNPDMEDGSLFMTSYVPLQLVSIVQTTEEITVLWKNPRPSSTRYCRPIRFQFVKETQALSQQEEQYYKEKISNLEPTSYKELKIHHDLHFTMVDGKVCSALSETACSRCFLCGATPKDMNLIDKCLKYDIDSTKLEFGLFHISYRLDFKRWQARSTEAKLMLADKKKKIQKEFKQKLGLIVDKPRSGGSGTSNDGNTARKFFANSAISADITGIKKDLIDRCRTILNCISSGYKINSTKYKEFALETARLLVLEYPWYNMPSSVHKILIHGAEVIDSMMIVSIGELSEEAAESTNKNLKIFRLNHTRKFSREVTNTDLLNRLFLNSDPYITSLRKLPKKNESTLSKDVISLLDM